MSDLPDDKRFFIPEPYPTILEPLAVDLPNVRPGYRVCDCGRFSDNDDRHLVTIGGISNGKAWRSKMSWDDGERELDNHRDDALRLRWQRMIQDADEFIERRCKDAY